MSDITLLDLVTLNNADPVIGLVESAITSYPELSQIPAVAHEGITFNVARRTAFPSAQFAQVGAGVTPSKSTFKLDRKEMFLMNSLLEIPKDYVTAQNKRVEDILAIEASGILKASFFRLCQQMYYGTSATLGGSAYTPDANGFDGFAQLTNSDTSDLEVNLGGAGGSSTSAYIVAANEQQTSLAVGKAGQLELTPWLEQLITISGSGNSVKKNMAYVSQMLGWFGLTFADQYSVWRVRNADGTTAAKSINDKALSQAIALIPTDKRNNIKIFVNRNGAAQLQESRSAVGFQTADGAGKGAYAPQPTDSNGFPVIVTEAITNTEA